MLKPGDYADGRTFLGWRVLFRKKRFSVFNFYDTREKAFAAKPFFDGTYTRRITRVYRKDSPLRAALRELFAECERRYTFLGSERCEPFQRAKEILNG